MNKFDISANLPNGLKAMHRLLAAGFCSVFLFASQANAQRYSMRKPPELKNEFSVGVFMLAAADVKMGSLGDINNNYYLEGEYDTAAIGEDNTAGTTAADGRTYNFSFIGPEQITDADGNPSFEGDYLKASSSRAVASEGQFDIAGDSGSMMGMEVQYVRYLTKERKLGLLVSISNAGFDFAQSRDWEVDVISRSDLYLTDGENFANYSDYTGSGTRPIVFTPSYPNLFLYYGDGSTINLGDVNMGQVDASGTWSVKASYTNFRLGAVYNMAITRRINLRASGGLVATYATSSFKWNATYSADYDAQEIEVSDSGASRKKKFLYGAWADLGAHYRINRSVTAFGGVEFQSTDSFEQKTDEGYKLEYDSSSQFYAKTGFTWAF